MYITQKKQIYGGSICRMQGRSQNLKALPQTFMKVFKVDDVTLNDVMQKKQRILRKKNYRFPIVIDTV